MVNKHTYRLVAVVLLIPYCTSKALPQFNNDPFDGIFQRPPSGGNTINQQFPQNGFDGNLNGFDNQSQDQGSSPSASTTTTPSPRMVGCLDRCRTQTIGSHNPVCATNGQTYRNRQGFDCARRCGAIADISYIGYCGRNPGGK